jgi:nucleoside-diphosphate-sugar epimerase
MRESERRSGTTRLLVVGATGMLGRPVVFRLREDGHIVRLLARDVRRARASLGAGFEYVDGDVGDPAAEKHLFVLGRKRSPSRIRFASIASSCTAASLTSRCRCRS